MTYRDRILCGVAVSLAAHVLLREGAGLLPAIASGPPPVVEVRVIEAPAEPPPEPPKPPPPLPPPPPPPVPEQAERHPVDHAVRQVVLPVVTPPTERPVADANPNATPHFGVTMESTSQAGGGATVPIGNTVKDPSQPPGEAGTKVEALPPPVEVAEVTTMPLPKGRCTGRYTDEARAAAVEGTVILDLVVGVDGRPREIKVVQGLGHGLSKAAVAALAACRFSPGARDGKPVAVRVRSFKIRFFLADAN